MNPQCGGNFYSVQKRSSVWGKISTVKRRDPQCGGKFLKCTEEILSVGEHCIECEEESSAWGNIV